ncbi:NADH-ubiquinone oxidoreductase [Lactarius hatsudake]|nr:NADH-ubiquinone oxidoreductase [Lactarius hatsudake]
MATVPRFALDSVRPLSQRNSTTVQDTPARRQGGLLRDQHPMIIKGSIRKSQGDSWIIQTIIDSSLRWPRYWFPVSRVDSAYIYTREFFQEATYLRQAITEAYNSGFIGWWNACGPAILKPFPAEVCRFGCPAAVSNVETASATPTIMCCHGPSWFASFGQERNRDTSISSQVNSPCVVEEETRISLKDFIEKQAEIVHDGWDRFPSYYPVGYSGLGNGAIIVMFNKQELRGQCSLWQECITWMMNITRLFIEPEGRGFRRETDMLLEGPQLTQVLASSQPVSKSPFEGCTIRALGDIAAWPIQGLMRHFRPEVEKCTAEFCA